MAPGEGTAAGSVPGSARGSKLSGAPFHNVAEIRSPSSQQGSFSPLKKAASLLRSSFGGEASPGAGADASPASMEEQRREWLGAARRGSSGLPPNLDAGLGVDPQQVFERLGSAASRLSSQLSHQMSRLSRRMSSQREGPPGEEMRIEPLTGIEEGEQEEDAGFGLTRPSDRDDMVLVRRASNVGWRYVSAKRSVDLFWLEKILLIWDAAQIWGLCWVMFQPYLPYQWNYRTKFSVWFNMDIANSEFRPLPGHRRVNELTLNRWERVVYLFVWAAYPLVLLGLRHLYVKSRVKRGIYTPDMKASSERWLLLACMITYTWFLMGTLPIVFCQDDWDGCDPWWYFILRMVLGVYCVGMAVCVPVLVFKLIHRQIVADDNEAHERYLRLKETEYLLDLNSHWDHGHIWLFSSYKRSLLRVYHRPILFAVKFIMVLVYSCFPTLSFIPQSERNMTQAMIVCVALLFVTILTWVRKLYRCYSTWLLQQAFFWNMCAYSLIAAIKTVEGYNSVFLVDATLSLILISIHMAIGIFIGIVLLICMGRSALRGLWPVTLEDADEIAMEHEDVVHDLQLAKRMLEEYGVTNRRYIPVDRVQAMMQNLEYHLNATRKYDHPFHWTVVDVLEDITDLYAEVKAMSYLPHPALEGVLIPLQKALRARRQELVLMNPKKRRILLKLVALRALCGKYLTEFDVAPLDDRYALPSGETPDYLSLPLIGVTTPKMGNRKSLLLSLGQQDEAQQRLLDPSAQLLPEGPDVSPDISPTRIGRPSDEEEDHAEVEPENADLLGEQADDEAGYEGEEEEEEEYDYGEGDEEEEEEAEEEEGEEEQPDEEEGEGEQEGGQEEDDND
ncbi:unnamed protein product [Vitrella brassicaformis CCMP3155]|uniref:Uncharacterized protein n=2 Tax=Vitrella brassicaformis TaxID=1169539 RepID=A0A0G4GM76_VITBC|nr:unnamed protein product [Vitrella brassicaformis CCMP3155]|eukprot:CEM31306.1 unnamed protein product [Vitrella brassicaformis CCMP3155]